MLSSLFHRRSYESMIWYIRNTPYASAIHVNDENAETLPTSLISLSQPVDFYSG
ncbi:hypothetical protein BofuT4_uP059890.1 [Botrytis cinerea T4]|uniref:Uncharacterized protein n=1 Tax=Botryotinia fuckeliana (strain T4) TaxID=999810 RepID=G2XUA0_BOTF4|nr:hypothetical protein BofuT4_uP059890.1 [Botrytis cinerea T4]